MVRRVLAGLGVVLAASAGVFVGAGTAGAATQDDAIAQMEAQFNHAVQQSSEQNELTTNHKPAFRPRPAN